MDHLLLDLRLAFRRLRRNPGFTIVAVLTLALGIGANTAVFSVINAVLLRPLPVPRSSELVAVNETVAGAVFPVLSYPDYRDFRDRNTVLSGLFAYRILPASLGIPGSSQRLWGYLVTGNYFDTLGVSAARGRLFTPDDDRRPPRGRTQLHLLATALRRQPRHRRPRRQIQWHGFHHPRCRAARIHRHRAVLRAGSLFPRDDAKAACRRQRNARQPPGG
jgi:hypothetical protein